MKNIFFIHEILQRLDRFAESDIQVVDGEILTKSRTIYFEIVNTMKNLGLKVYSEPEVVNGMICYRIQCI